jgi:PPIC-type PPIASE domain
MTYFTSTKFQLGLMLTGLLLMSIGSFSLPEEHDDLVVSYDGGGISRIQLSNALEMLQEEEASRSEEVPGSEDILNFLVDEALLIERAKSLGIVESDVTIRKALSRAMIDKVASEAVINDPTLQQLEEFYQLHLPLFQRPDKIHITQYFFKSNPNTSSESSILQSAMQARQKLMLGESIEELISPIVSALPSGFLDQSALPKYIGPHLATQAQALEAGEVSHPIAVKQGFYLLVCHGRIEGSPLPFSQVEDDVLLEFQRRARDAALRILLDDLWQNSVVSISENVNFSTNSFYRRARDE